jgi:hypothetical protein
MTNTPTRATRFLTWLSTVLLVLSIGFGLFLLVGAVAGFGPSGHEVAVHTRVAATRVAELPKDAVEPDDVGVTVRVRQASREQTRWAAARDLAPGIVVVAAVWLLRGLLTSVRGGDPFTNKNVTRLRALGLVVLVGVPAAGLVSSAFESALANSAGLDGSGIHLAIPGNAFLGGLAVFVLAEVFAAGVRLRDDLEGTI